MEQASDGRRVDRRRFLAGVGAASAAGAVLGAREASAGSAGVPPSEAPGIIGRVTAHVSQEAMEIVVDPGGADRRTRVELLPDATVVRDGTLAQLADFGVGEGVYVYGTERADGTFAARSVVRGFLGVASEAPALRSQRNR